MDPSLVHCFPCSARPMFGRSTGESNGGILEGKPMLTNLLLWALFGLIAGAVAKFIMPGKDPGGNDVVGLLITMVIGIAGAVVGGYLSSQLFGWDVTGFNLPSFAIAIVGALLLLIVYRLATSSQTR